jgi:hypothetical protein
MNRSYSKIRNINSVNYLLEQKYLEDKRNTDRGVLVEQQPEEEDNWMKNVNSSYFDRSANKDYSKFPCVSSLKIAKWNRLRFDANYYYFPNGNYATIADVNKYSQDYATNPNTTLNYAGTYSCKETINDITNQKTSSIQRSENQKETNIGWENYPCVTSNSTAKKLQLPVGTVAYDINGEIYYGNGRKKGLNGQMSNYYCDGTNIKDGDKPSSSQTETNNQSSSQASNTNTTTSGGDFGTIYPNVFTPSVVNLIKGKIGSSDKSSSLTQDDINKLYDAIDK